MSRNMVDSGVEWIGKIPDNVGILKAKYLFSFQKGKLPTSVNNDGRGLPCIGASEMNGAEPSNYTEDNLPTCHKSDVLLLWDGANAGLVSTGHEGIVASTVCRVRLTSNLCFPRFAYYTLKNAERYYRDKVGGTTIPHMNPSYINDTLIVNFDYQEQQRISAFLDKKCSAIDDVLAKTQESIEEYKKLKQAVITEAVTKGVRGKRPMKDSGIDWIGQIPKDWDADKLKRILIERMENNDPIQTTERLSLSIDTGVTLYAEKTTNLDRFKEDVSQYKLAHVGDLVMNSMNVIVGAVGVSNYFGCVSPAYYTYYDKELDHVTARYMDYVFRTKSLRALLYRLGKGIYAIDRGDGKVNTCRLKVSRDDMRSLKLPLPSVDEQREIVLYLDKKCAAIDALISKKQQFIEELTAYKKSLIYEYVTGKKEVPA